MTFTLHHGDLPAGLDLGAVVAVDAEMMGLNPHRDRLCLVQLSSGDGTAHLVKFDAGAGYDAPRLKKLLADQNVLKILHFARADVGHFLQYLGVLTAPVYCTKTASRIARTFTEHHSYKFLCKDVLGVDLDKQHGTSDWGALALTAEQLNYAASDVYHLHALRDRLEEMLHREGRAHLAHACNDFIPHRAQLDVSGWDYDVFAHNPHRTA